ncbi:hypothetical protein [Paenibacillus polymyxa]|uniref:hypothetical protein n=1 Tax=Paenibacillus polymyxa TaxID=1406 RepID=UPI0001E6CA53|nr:hypothetical protein [Paenibacillus polymyxa]WPQ59709.1 hypothetical protein SKN87_29045 [Paenibacillus polymyxa]
MIIENRKFWITNETLEYILNRRDEYEIDTHEWTSWNELKAEWLEYRKPSNKESIIYFKEMDLLDIPAGFSEVATLPLLAFQVGKRSLLEYDPAHRHPIPYVIVKHGSKYFFILRETGSGELRLIGKKGMLGGHVGAEDIDSSGLNQTILNGLMRELNEEAAIDETMIQSIQLKGLIKGDEGVDCDHLGIVYRIDLNTDQIETQEDGVQKGIWIHEDELERHFDLFESWSKITFTYLLRK